LIFVALLGARLLISMAIFFLVYWGKRVNLMCCFYSIF